MFILVLFLHTIMKIYSKSATLIQQKCLYIFTLLKLTLK